MAGRGGRARFPGDGNRPGTLNQAPQFASSDQLAEMESAMLELEEMLRDVEDVSSIIEFNASSTGAAANSSSERGLFRAAGGGAAVLAQAVAEDLKKWHDRNEMHVVEYGAEHADRLRKSVHAQKREQESREFVRAVVRERLFDIASGSLATSVPEVTNTRQKVFKDQGVEVGNSLEAFGNLQNRMEAAITPLFSLQGEPPQEMLAASRAARWAVERKKQRSVGRRHRLPELENHLDTTLMDEVEESMGQRKAELYEQCELQVGCLRQLEEAQLERQTTHEQFEGLMKAGSSSDADPWKTLWPAGAEAPLIAAASHSDRAREKPARLDARGHPVMPQLGFAVEEAIAETLTPQLLKQGSCRIRDLRSDFYQSYLAKDSGERARMVGSELERWQLTTKLDLLKELTAMSQTTHLGIMDQLRSSLEFKDDDPSDQMERTLQAADAFHNQRHQFFDGQIEAAEIAISSFCQLSIEQLLSLRRRTELASLKRWNDVGAGLNASLDASWIKCQVQLAEEVRQSVSDCHKSMKLPVENLDIERGRKQVDFISVAWKRCGTHIPQQLLFLESITKGLPATVESCTVAKAALMQIEVEIERIIESLKAPVEQ